MNSIRNAASLIVAVSMIGFVLAAQQAYQASWSGNVIEPMVTAADTSSAGTTFTATAETVAMK
jgi:hypothetical protein